MSVLTHYTYTLLSTLKLAVNQCALGVGGIASKLYQDISSYIYNNIWVNDIYDDIQKKNMVQHFIADCSW